MPTIAKKKPVTLKAVAQKANCSVSSVSTVLNKASGNSVVGEEMRKRIMDVANELGYRPNFASRILKKQRSNTIGIYIQPSKWRSIGSKYEGPIMKGIEQSARELEYDMLILNMATQVMPEICGERLAESRIDGIILIHADRETDWVSKLASEHENVVAVDCCYENKKLNRVYFDNPAAVRMAVKHLYDLGHRRIGYIGACTEEALVSVEAHTRDMQFPLAMRELGLEVQEELIFDRHNCFPPISSEDKYCQAEGIAALNYFTKMKNPPTAVLAYNSLVGCTMIVEAKKIGFDIPKQMSLIAFDDFEFLHMIDPELTTIDHALEDLGRSGAKMLVDIIEGKAKTPATIIHKPSLIQGTSTIKVTDQEPFFGLSGQ